MEDSQQSNVMAYHPPVSPKEEILSDDSVDQMDLTPLKEEPTDDDYQVQSQFTFCPTFAGGEIITNNIPVKETQAIAQRSSNLNEYYESLRNNVITLLEHVRLPPSGNNGGNNPSVVGGPPSNQPNQPPNGNNNGASPNSGGNPPPQGYQPHGNMASSSPVVPHSAANLIHPHHAHHHNLAYLHPPPPSHHHPIHSPHHAHHLQTLSGHLQPLNGSPGHLQNPSGLLSQGMHTSSSPNLNGVHHASPSNGLHHGHLHPSGQLHPSPPSHVHPLHHHPLHHSSNLHSLHPQTANGLHDQIHNASSSSSSSSSASSSVSSSPEKITHENFDSYITKLQTLCGPGGGGGPGQGAEYCPPEENRPLYETVRSALQDFTVLPTPI